VRDADSPDPRILSLALEPGQMLLPRDEVVDLLELEAPEPLELAPELATPLLHPARPDLRRHDRRVAPPAESD
jgi:hypothetical protein